MSNFEKLNKIIDDYRSCQYLNYSTLSQIDSDPSKLQEEKKGVALKKGSEFEDLLFFPDFFHHHHIIEKDIAPTATSLDLVEYAKDHNISLEEALDAKDGSENYIFWKGVKDPKTRAKKINESLEKYLDFLIESEGKKIVSKEDYHNYGSGIVILRTNELSKDYIRGGTAQKPFYVKMNGVWYKALLDYIIETEDEVWPVDLKTTSKSIYASESSIFFYRWDIQSSLYTSVLREFYPNKKVHPLTNIIYSFKDEKVLPVKYSEDQIQKSKFGFYRGDRYYKGWKELTDEYFWHKNNNKFLYKKEIYDNKGLIL